MRDPALYPGLLAAANAAARVAHGFRASAAALPRRRLWDRWHDLAMAEAAEILETVLREEAEHHRPEQGPSLRLVR